MGPWQPELIEEVPSLIVVGGGGSNVASCLAGLSHAGQALGNQRSHTARSGDVDSMLVDGAGAVSGRSRISGRDSGTDLKNSSQLAERSSLASNFLGAADSSLRKRQSAHREVSLGQGHVVVSPHEGRAIRILLFDLQQQRKCIGWSSDLDKRRTQKSTRNRHNPVIPLKDAIGHFERLDRFFRLTDRQLIESLAHMRCADGVWVTDEFEPVRSHDM